MGRAGSRLQARHSAHGNQDMVRAREKCIQTAPDTQDPTAGAELPVSKPAAWGFGGCSSDLNPGKTGVDRWPGVRAER